MRADLVTLREGKCCVAALLMFALASCGSKPKIDELLIKHWHQSRDQICSKRVTVMSFDKDTIRIATSDKGEVLLRPFSIKQIEGPKGARGTAISFEFPYRSLTGGSNSDVTTVVGVQLVDNMMIGRAVLQNGTSLSDELAEPLLRLFTRQECSPQA